MANELNEAYWNESNRLKQKNARRAERRKANPKVRNPRSLSNKKEK